jgi:hypothetical protein
MQGCVFESCVWKLDYLIHDKAQVDLLRVLLADIEKSIPLPPEDQGPLAV